MRDRIDGPVLYKEGCAKNESRILKRELSMLISWTHKEQTAKRRPSAGMLGVRLFVELSLSAVNIFGGGLAQRQTSSIDRKSVV